MFFTCVVFSRQGIQASCHSNTANLRDLSIHVDQSFTGMSDHQTVVKYPPSKYIKLKNAGLASLERK